MTDETPIGDNMRKLLATQNKTDKPDATDTDDDGQEG